MIGNILIIFNESFFVRSIKGTVVTYYEIPLREIKQILGTALLFADGKELLMVACISHNDFKIGLTFGK
jgi:hypothetical protein